MTDSALPDDIRSLPVCDRVVLVEQIWASIVEDEREFTFTKAQQEEIDRRLAQRSKTGSAGASWEEAKRRITGA